jgi:hypothetical protein
MTFLRIVISLSLMEHPQKGGISPGTPLKAAAEIAEFHQLPR